MKTVVVTNSIESHAAKDNKEATALVMILSMVLSSSLVHKQCRSSTELPKASNITLIMLTTILFPDICSAARLRLDVRDQGSQQITPPPAFLPPKDRSPGHEQRMPAGWASLQSTPAAIGWFPAPSPSRGGTFYGPPEVRHRTKLRQVRLDNALVPYIFTNFFA